MTTAATAKIIKLAGSSNPPSLVALYGSTLGERKNAMSDLQNDLFGAGLSIIDFNARRYLSENDLSQPLVQQIVTELKSNTDTTGATADLVNRINESAAAAISTHLTSENRIELIHQFDSSMKKLSAISLQKKPLVILVQGMERAPTGAFMAISDFIANYLNIHKFMFILSVGEDLLNNELNSSNTNMSPDEFLEDIFSSVVTFDETTPTIPEPEPIPELNNDDLFAPPVGLEVESGTDIIAKRKGGRVIPKSTGKPKSRIFKVRELSGKKTTIKKGRGVPRKIIKKAPAASPKKFKAIEKKNDFNQFIDPILKADVFSVKKFWGKVSSLAYKEFTQLVNMILKETTNRDSRIRATAITALASIAKGVSWEMPPEVMDRALILTSDGSNEVKDAAAEAIREMNEAGVEKTPQFTPTPETKKKKSNNSMELSELDTDSMLGTGSNSIGSLSIGSGSGGVKVMGGETAGISSAPTFEVSKDIPSYEEKKPAQFKAVSDKPTKFKAVDDKTPKFKSSEKKKAEFKVVK